LAVNGAHGAAGLIDVVEKNTMSPATAGNAVTFSSGETPSVASSRISAVFDAEVPLSRSTKRL
jgi:hypothetical protein